MNAKKCIALLIVVWLSLGSTLPVSSFFWWQSWSSGFSQKMWQYGWWNMKDLFEDIDLSDDTQEELEDIYEKYQDLRSELMEEMRSGGFSSSQAESIKEDMQSMQEDMYDEIEELLEDNNETEALEELENIREDMEEKMWQNTKKFSRETFSEDKYSSEKRSKRDKKRSWYKSSFSGKLGKSLNKYSDDTLESVIDKIDDLIEKYEDNDDISEEKQEDIILQLEALRELVEEEMDN